MDCLNNHKDKEYRKNALPIHISILDRLKQEAEEELEKLQLELATPKYSKSKNRKRKENINFRATTEEYQDIAKNAEKQGVSVSEFIRKSLS